MKLEEEWKGRGRKFGTGKDWQKERKAEFFFTANKN